MPPPGLFDDPDDTREAIMRATYDALCEHGYADLTIQRIGAEFPKSASLVYHHYDGKDDLLLEFLTYLLDHFETSVPPEEYDDAATHLQALLDHVLPDELDDERRQFRAAMIELRAQAAHDPAYRDHFTRSTRFFHDRLTAIIERGIEEGVFRDVDPERVAALILTTMDGSIQHSATTDLDELIPAVRAELEAYVDTVLRADPKGTR